MENTYHVVLLEDPEQRVFSIRKTIGVDQYHALFEELRREAAARGLQQAGPIQDNPPGPFCHLATRSTGKRTPVSRSSAGVWWGSFRYRSMAAAQGRYSTCSASQPHSAS